MRTPATSPSARITVLSAPACHFCEDADAAIEAIGQDFAIEVEHLAIESPEGARLVAEHRPAMTPLVLVDGEFFSAGRLPRRKMIRMLSRRASDAETLALMNGVHRGQ
ncbi:hypothetical protein GCM10023065_13290 [Microbacterium laevaniformans]|uniref:Thioredoxin-like fold domain-containing protein n=1 Tax=Microbacterium laevaniformans TaxID=36807 RepID=A0A150HH05_9MICO|nr:hypothetical protein Mlaev_00403 [Microbacterium laevaniformans]GLJ64667.1 hypothetical protein GCM10017578_15560 [Microbacterium laevaniformans]